MERVDSNSSIIMYIKKITNGWDSHHLLQCGWYLDCPKLNISFKEKSLHEQLDLGFMMEEPEEEVIAIQKVISKRKSFVIGQVSRSIIVTKKNEHKLGTPTTQSTSSLHDDDAFKIFEPSFQHYRKEAMKIGLQFSVMHNASILALNSLPPSLFTSFTHLKVSLAPPNFKFKMQEKILNTFFTFIIDTKTRT